MTFVLMSAIGFLTYLDKSFHPVVWICPKWHASTNDNQFQNNEQNFLALQSTI